MGNAAGVVMLVAAGLTLWKAGEPNWETFTQFFGGLWFAMGGVFLGLGRGLPMLLLGRAKVGGLLKVIAAATNEPEPVRAGTMVRVRGAVFLFAGLTLCIPGLGLALAAVFDAIS